MVHVIDQISPSLDAARDYMKTPEQDAATTVYAALRKKWEGRRGRYFEDCQEAEKTNGASPPAPGYHPRAYNEASEKKLCTKCLDSVEFRDDEKAEPVMPLALL